MDDGSSSSFLSLTYSSFRIILLPFLISSHTLLRSLVFWRHRGHWQISGQLHFCHLYSSCYLSLTARDISVVEFLEDGLGYGVYIRLRFHRQRLFTNGKREETGRGKTNFDVPGGGGISSAEMLSSSSCSTPFHEGRKKTSGCLYCGWTVDYIITYWAAKAQWENR